MAIKALKNRNLPLKIISTRLYKNYFKNLDDLQTSYKEAAGTAYKKAFDNTDVLKSDKIDELLQRPAAKRILLFKSKSLEERTY